MLRGFALGVLVLVAAGGARAGSYEPPPGDHAPVWSPDGSAIVYVSRRRPSGYHVMDPDGSGDRLLPLPGPGYGEPAVFAFAPGWSWIAFGGQELVVSRPDGTGRRRLSHIAFASLPAWSPDAGRLAFSRPDGLHVIGVDGSRLRRVSERNGSRPDWSPDGGLIAFDAHSAGEGDIFVVRPDGTEETNLTSAVPGSHDSPVWSPDGSRLAFFTREERRPATVTEVPAPTGSRPARGRISCAAAAGETYSRVRAGATRSGPRTVSGMRSPAGRTGCGAQAPRATSLGRTASTSSPATVSSSTGPGGSISAAAART